MDYIGTMSRGWQIVWKNKFMWVLGFVAALAGGGAGSSFNFGGDSGAMPNAEEWAAILAGATALLCLSFVVGIVLWIVGLAAKGGLIEAVAREDRHVPVAGFGEAFRLGWHYVWRLVGLSLILFGIPLLIFMIATGGFVVSGGAFAAMSTLGDSPPDTAFAGIGILGLCFVLLLCLTIPLFIVLNYVYAFAMRGLVLRDLGVVESIRHGWRVLMDNLGAIILLSIGFLLLNLVIAVVIAAIVFFLGLVVSIPLNLLSGGNFTSGQGILFLLMTALIAIVSALVRALLLSWQSSTFTLAYLEFTNKDLKFEEA